jgi:hypothetical protein
MPLLDHFHPPLSSEHRWESFHANWATKIADALTERWLPSNYIAEEHVHIGPAVEIDVATLETGQSATSSNGGGGIAIASRRVWTPAAPDAVLSVAFPVTFEIRVLCMDTGPKLVAAIELVSPSNKDRSAERRAFATKCASYIFQGISLIIVDIVASRHANLHNEILRVMEVEESQQMAPEAVIYAIE